MKVKGHEMIQYSYNVSTDTYECRLCGHAGYTKMQVLTGKLIVPCSGSWWERA